MKFLELATKVLTETKKPMSAQEIWKYAMEKDYVKLVETSGVTPQATFGSRLYTAANEKDSQFEVIGVRPKRFFLPGITSVSSLKIDVGVDDDNEEPSVKYLEKDLHCVLAYFVRTWFDAYPKTINHSKSKKKEFGEWTHPDMVACYFPSRHWKTDVHELSQMLGDVQLFFYSFEIKQRLTFSNLRESFFQAVSNSSWAHQGFLVAAEISDEPEFYEELSRLSASFGIGVIRLNLANPDDCEIHQPARETEYLEWDMVNKLAVMNDDFRAFLNRVKSDVKSEEVRIEWYDKLMEPEEIIAKFKRLGLPTSKS
jgi:hypothetical protein